MLLLAEVTAFQLASATPSDPFYAGRQSPPRIFHHARLPADPRMSGTSHRPQISNMFLLSATIYTPSLGPCGEAFSPGANQN